MSSQPTSSARPESRLASEIAVGCRVTVMRNLAQFPFLSTCSDHQRIEIADSVRMGWQTCHQPSRPNDSTNELSSTDWSLFDTDHRDISRQKFWHLLESLAGLNSNLIQREVWINDENHVHIEVSRRDTELTQAWAMANEADDCMEARLDFAFHPRWGYLTACPADVGTGLRVRVLLHLPALSEQGEINRWLRLANRHNVAGHELLGDPQGGDFYQFSNQNTLGYTELQLIQQLGAFMPQVQSAERAARIAWKDSGADTLQGRINIACDRLMDVNLDDDSDLNRVEILRMISQIRLGIDLQLLPTSQVALVAARLELVHLRKQMAAALSQEEYRKAAQIRDRIQILERGEA